MPYDVPRIAAPGGLEPTFRADLRTIKTMKDQGWELFPAANPPVVNNGLFLNGTTQYAKRTAVDVMARFMAGPANEFSWVIEFIPNITWPMPSDRYLTLFDLDHQVATGYRYVVMPYRVGGVNVLWCGLGGNVRLLNPTPAALADNWRFGERNILVLAAKSGDVTQYLNEVVFDQSAIAVNKVHYGSKMMGLGAEVTGFTAQFPGVILRLELYNRKLTQAEVLAL